MSLKVAINGFGRIGRSVARIIANRSDVELVAINDLSDPDMIKYLLDNDSVHGHFNLETKLLEDDYIQIGDMKVKMFSDKNPENLEFGKLGAEVVLECTGVFLTQEKAKVHLKDGVKKVVFSAPAKDDTATYVIGVNNENYQGEEIISNASCTTNCLAPIAKVLDDAFGIEKGLMTTIHSYTNDQNILDVKHKKDKRRARAAAINMIPTTTGAAKALSLVLPQLKGKMHGQSVRVPTPNVSMVDLNVVVKKNVSKDEVNQVLREKAENELKGIIAIDSNYGVSQDFVGNPNSSIVAEDLTQVIDGNLVKVMAWYDNEWGYSNRLVDMAVFVSNK